MWTELLSHPYYYYYIPYRVSSPLGHPKLVNTKSMTTSCWQEVNHNNTNLYRRNHTYPWHVSDDVIELLKSCVMAKPLVWATTLTASLTVRCCPCSKVWRGFDTTENVVAAIRITSFPVLVTMMFGSLVTLKWLLKQRRPCYYGGRNESPLTAIEWTYTE